MKNKKGFTLIELTAVVTLISIIAILASIPINKMLKDSREKLNEKQKEQIVLAASNWVVDNPYLLPPYIDETSVKLTIEQLFNDGYLDTEIVDLRNKEKVKNCSYVEITLNTDAADGYKHTYNYEYYELKTC